MNASGAGFEPDHACLSTYNHSHWKQPPTPNCRNPTEMSKLSILRRSWDYEGNVPRCSICSHFKASHIRLTTNSQTKVTNHHCLLGGFTIHPNGVCKNWAGKDGSALEQKL